MQNNGKYKHGEAFMLMLYASDDKSAMELLWNSRDGVTPFMLDHASGKLMQHVAWQKDVRIERFLPPVGMRVFVDLTREKAEAFASKWAEEHWGNPEDEYALCHLYATKEEAEAAWIKREMEERPGQPDVVVVDEAFQKALLAMYAAEPGPVETHRPWDCYQFLYRQPVRFA